MNTIEALCGQARLQRGGIGTQLLVVLVIIVAVALWFATNDEVGKGAKTPTKLKSMEATSDTAHRTASDALKR